MGVQTPFLLDLWVFLKVLVSRQHFTNSGLNDFYFSINEIKCALFLTCVSEEPYRELSVCQSAEASFTRLTENFTTVRHFLRCIC